MIIATIAIAALLGSASVAQAGRKCIACGILTGAEEEEEAEEKRHTCGTEDLSKYLALPAQKLTYHGISIKDCGDNPCYSTREAYLNPESGSLAGRPIGERGCFTPKLRAKILAANWKVPSTNSPAACKKKVILEAEGAEREVCIEVCDTDRCNVKLHRSRAARANRDASAARANRVASVARAIRDANAARASIKKQKARNSA